MCYLAHLEEGALASAQTIAIALGIPQEQAAKVMQALAAQNLVVSHVGRTGGYAPARPLAEVSLCKILEAFDTVDEERRLRPASCKQRENAQVNPEELCSAHRGLCTLNDQVREALSGLTLAPLDGTLCAFVECAPTSAGDGHTSA